MTRRYGREQVLAALRRGAGRSLHAMEIVQLLGAPKDAKDDVRDVLVDLARLGLARELPGNRWKVGSGRREALPESAAGRGDRTRRRDPARSGGETVAGWLTVSPRGFGFVAVDDAGPDVFVPARALGFAMHGDRVEVAVRRSPQGREGEVVRVLERGLLRVAGVLVRTRRDTLLETNDPRLPPVFRIVGTLPLGAEPGMEVLAQISRWPERDGELPEARVLRTLGPRGSAEVEIQKILVREGVVEEFPEDVVQEALGLPHEVPEADLRGREDLRHLDFVTIDPEDARDHDDALWAEELPDGGYRVIVAIADVSHYVRAGSAIDREAQARGCSIYLPGRAIPMLPPELSANLASLVPGEDRLTLAVEVRLGRRGRVVSHRLIEGVMRSRARLSYPAVARVLGLVAHGPVQPEAEAHVSLLRTLHTISTRLRSNRQRRGALEFDLPEAKVVLDRAGEPIDVVRSRADPGIARAYAIVEDLMLLANEVVARDLRRRHLPAIYRVHGRPDPRRVQAFAAVAEAFGHAIEEDAHESPKKLQRFLATIAGTRHAQTLGFLLLRAMQQASYDVANLGHFALAAQDYLHFTSPIRRYPDLAVHRVVRLLARGERIDAPSLRQTLREQAARASRMERRAMGIEREAINLYRCLLVQHRLGEELEGTITGVTEHGLWVAIDAPFVEVRVPLERLGDDSYELDRLGIRLVARRSGHAFTLGDRVAVRLEAVNVAVREILAVPVSLPEARSAGRRERSGSRRRVGRSGHAAGVGSSRRTSLGPRR